MINLNLVKKNKLRLPFFIYKESIIEKRFLKLKRSLPKNFKIFYSVKANPNIHILRIIKKLGANVEISSGGELSLVLKVGFSPEQIVFTGPGKTDEELKRALTKRIYLIIVESLNELIRIEKIAHGLNIKQKILLRVNPIFFVHRPGHMKFNFSGEGQKFGIDENCLPAIIKYLRKFKNIELQGLHLFPGTNIQNEKIVLDYTEQIFKIVKDLELKFFINSSVIDIGGGIGINYSSNVNKEFNLNKLFYGFKKLIDKYKFRNRKIILETGRFLVGESGEYIAQVVDIKKSGNKKFVIVDGGRNHLSSAALLNVDHKVELLNKEYSSGKEVVDLVGNLNTSQDIISKTYISRKVKIGDLLSVKNQGAYGFSVGWILFCSRSIPQEYLLTKNGEIKNITKRELMNIK